MNNRGTAYEVRVTDEKWTATIKVRGLRTAQKANSAGYFDDTAVTSISEPMELTVVAGSLEKLQAKIKAHVDLLEDEL